MKSFLFEVLGLKPRDLTRIWSGLGMPLSRTWDMDLFLGLQRRTTHKMEENWGKKKTWKTVMKIVPCEYPKGPNGSQ